MSRVRSRNSCISSVWRLCRKGGYLPSLTVEENLRIGAFGRYDAKRFAADLEDFFTLPILKERYNQAGGLLSGGEQQMLAIARGLISHPTC